MDKSSNMKKMEVLYVSQTPIKIQSQIQAFDAQSE